MEFRPPAPAPDEHVADWLATRLMAERQGWVPATAGAGFEAYVRVFHPPGERRWAEVAASHGRTMNPSIQWEQICTPTLPDDVHERVDRDENDPEIGNLEPATLRALCDVLARYTTSPERCWFGVWEGWGWFYPGSHSTSVSFASDGDQRMPVSAPSSWQLKVPAPLLDVVDRRYLLYGGPLDAALRIGQWVTDEWFIPQSPSLFWPDDHAWCAATEIDFDSTIVGGAEALADDLIACTDIEALRIEPDARYWIDLT